MIIIYLQSLGNRCISWYWWWWGKLYTCRGIMKRTCRCWRVMRTGGFSAWCSVMQLSTAKDITRDANSSLLQHRYHHENSRHHSFTFSSVRTTEEQKKAWPPYFPSREHTATNSLLGTCESFFFVRIESSNRISRIYHASRNTAWRSAGVPYRPIICWRLALWTNESDLRNWVLVHFNSVIKRVKQCRCTLI